MPTRYHTPPLPTARPVTPGLVQARAARLASTDALLAVIDEGSAVRELVNQVQEHGRRNHWADVFEETMRRRPT